MAVDDLRSLTGCNIRMLQASEKDVVDFISQHFGASVIRPAPGAFSPAWSAGRSAAADYAATDDTSVVNLVNSIILDAVAEDASDIHFEPNEHGLQVRVRVDGIMRNIMDLPPRLVSFLVSRIKVMANLDITNRRTPQDGRVSQKIAGAAVDMRISTIPTVYGEKVAIHIFDNKKIKTYTLDALGFASYNQEQFLRLLKRPSGMILLSGPTGGGKTTTLYTALNVLNTTGTNIVTLEDPVEYLLDGINQIEVHSEIGASFASYLRSILRQDPDVIMIGEIRDAETAEIAVRSAITGHLVLSTLHANDSPGIVIRLIDMGIEPFMVASSVRGAVFQRLVRRICPNCHRVRHRLTDEERAFAGIEDQDVTLYEGSGCKFCNHTGYRGRIAILELMTVTPAIQEMIRLNSVSDKELRDLALREGMVSLKEDGINRVLQGVTTIQEIMKVI
jgi:type IV pilus assembly protein PilB